MLGKIRWTMVFSLVSVLAMALAACGPATTANPTAAPRVTQAATAANPTAAPKATQAAGQETGTATPAPMPTAETKAPQAVTIMATKNPTVGEILTDSQGMTLYTFKNDKAGESTCFDTCAQNWPPLTVAKGEQPQAGEGVSGKLGVIERESGSYQVTYNDMPLYHYKADTKPGDINGQGINNVWYVASVAPGGPGVATSGGKIALLLPESKTTRYEAHDRPDFENKLKELCPSCQIIYSNANQDANQQLSQAEAALTNGAQVMVLDPVDSAAAAAIADKAKAQGVPVIAYDRLILNTNSVNYYISFDNYKVGQLQAQSLVDRLNQEGVKNPVIVMINGAPTDNNAKLFKAGAHSVFDPLVTEGKLAIAKEYDTPDWSPDQAQNEMQQALTALGNKVDGIYCANDGTASGAVAAMKAAGMNPLPPVTGQDAELAAIQRILGDEQYMTVYKAIMPEADAAAQLAYDLLTNAQVPATMTEGKTVNNGTFDVPSVLLTPVAVTKDNVNATVVKDGFWTVQQICTDAYSSACKAAGLG